MFLLMVFLPMTALTALYWGVAWQGKVLREAQLLASFFFLSAIFNWLVIGFLDTDSGLDPWMCLVGPAVVLAPFATMIAGMMPRIRSLMLRIILAVIASLFLTTAWFFASEIFA